MVAVDYAALGHPTGLEIWPAFSCHVLDMLGISSGGVFC